MSAQLLSSKKKQKRTHQSSIGSFLSVPKNLPVAQRTNAGMIRCPYCPAGTRLFSPQGFATHLNMHKVSNDPMLIRRKHGGVKVRFDKMEQHEIDAYNAERNEVIAIDDDTNNNNNTNKDDDDMEVVDEGEELYKFFNPNQGGTSADTSPSAQSSTDVAAVATCGRCAIRTILFQVMAYGDNTVSFDGYVADPTVNYRTDNSHHTLQVIGRAFLVYAQANERYVRQLYREKKVSIQILDEAVEVTRKYERAKADGRLMGHFTGTLCSIHYFKFTYQIKF